MLTFCIVANNIILITLLVLNWRRRRKLTDRLKRVGEMYLQVSADNRALQNEKAHTRARRLETRYKLEELRRDTLMLLGSVEWSQEAIAPKGDNDGHV